METGNTADTGDAGARVLAAALGHVPFDGWSATTLRAAAADAGVALALAQAVYPRGGVDLALAYHRQGDAAMAGQLGSEDLAALRFRDRIARAVRLRLEHADRELVRRGATLFALPIHAADGARAVWGTADTIWTALGDTARDFSWMTKRATLSGVYAATVVYWLGDDSPGHHATWDFLDRRIEDVMRIEKAKAALRDNPLARMFANTPLARAAQKWRVPDVPDDLPGRFRP
ncbi:MAG: COQ9 family protein [Gemmobacter sp.]